MKIRTLSGTIAEIKTADPDSAVTISYLRRLVRDGEIPSVMDGNRALVDVDAVIEYLHSSTFP